MGGWYWFFEILKILKKQNSKLKKIQKKKTYIIKQPIDKKSVLAFFKLLY